MLAVFWVFLGGGLGSATRYLTSDLVAKWLPQLPFLSTLLVNITGSALLGFLLTFCRQYTANIWFMPLVLVGFCGGFTTFSTYILDVYSQFMSGRFWLAYTLLTAHVTLGLLAAGLGIWLALRIHH